MAISISYDKERAKLYGHFAVAEGTKCNFYRYPIQSFVFNFNNRGWKPIRDFVRASYDTFCLSHLFCIRTALVKMEDSRNFFKISSMSIGESDDLERSQNLGQVLDMSAPSPSSQGTSVFKLTSEPASKRQKEALALLREQMAEQQKQSREQLAQSKDQMAALERRMVEQQMTEQLE